MNLDKICPKCSYRMVKPFRRYCPNCDYEYKMEEIEKEAKKKNIPFLLGMSLEEFIESLKEKFSEIDNKLRERRICEHCKFKFSLHDLLISESLLCPNCNKPSSNKTLFRLTTYLV